MDVLTLMRRLIAADAQPSWGLGVFSDVLAAQTPQQLAHATGPTLRSVVAAAYRDADTGAC